MEKRFLALYCPTDVALVRARKRGRTENDGTSVWDWLEPEEFEVRREFTSFATAVAQAKRWLPLDIFGETQVIEQHSQREPWGVEWSDVASWHVNSAARVHSAKPDHRFHIYD